MPSAEPVPDATVSRAVAGDSHARAELLKRHGPMVFGLCRRLAPDPEDCYQEVWEKAFRALHRFDPGGRASFAGWLATITHRHLVDRHRRRRVRGTVLPLTGLAATGPSAEELVGRHHRARRLEAALARLPDAQRRVVVMHHLSGLPLARVAESEGVALGTVKSRLHRGRARLAVLLLETP